MEWNDTMKNIDKVLTSLVKKTKLNNSKQEQQNIEKDKSTEIILIRIVNEIINIFLHQD